MAATPVAGAVLSKYADHDPSTRAEWISGDLAEETRLPRELVLRLYDMWFARDRPFFDKVSDDGVLAPKDLVEVIRTLKIDDVLLCNSVAGVISEGRPVTFDVFIRGYAALNSRTLRDALPFAFKVFDLVRAYGIVEGTPVRKFCGSSACSFGSALFILLGISTQHCSCYGGGSK